MLRDLTYLVDFEVGRSFCAPQVLLEVETGGIEVVALDSALRSLAKIDDRKSRVVELRYFGGLSLEETAEVLGVSQETAKRDWKMARAWLYTQLAGKPTPAEI